MYEEFYGFSEKPFSIVPDPKFLYFSQCHRMAYSMLEYGIVNQAGFSVVTGEVGSGKTTLVRRLLSNISDEITVGLISNTSKEYSGLTEWILMAFGQPFESGSDARLFMLLDQFLRREFGMGRRSILIVDEAQNLTPNKLDELRMLSNINAEDQLLQLILVGQPELRDTLRSPQLLQFSQRISVDYHLRPLRLDEADQYVEHRLHVAGGPRELFTRDAKELLFRASRGVPRLINILSDVSLVYGYAAGAPKITGDIVANVVEDKREHGILPLDYLAVAERPVALG